MVGFKEAFFFEVLRLDAAELAELVYREGLNVSPEAVQFESLLATLVLRGAMGDEASLEPLSVGDLPRGEVALRERFEAWGARHLPPARSPLHRPASALLDETTRRVVEDLGGVEGALDPRFVTAVLIEA